MSDSAGPAMSALKFITNFDEHSKDFSQLKEDSIKRGHAIELLMVKMDSLEKEIERNRAIIAEQKKEINLLKENQIGIVKDFQKDDQNLKNQFSDIVKRSENRVNSKIMAILRKLFSKPEDEATSENLDLLEVVAFDSETH